MKKCVYVLLMMTALVVSSCHNGIWDAINNLDARVAALEKLCQEMNTNITALETIVDVLQSNDYIKSVTEVKRGNEVIGYTIIFGNHEPITIYNGEDGEGSNVPVIGVALDTDGNYYWTLDGEWLLDNNGNKLRVTGNDGQDGEDAIVPLLKIENDYWYVSYDNGTTWTQLDKATGEDGQSGESMFQSVTEDENFVYFTLADGTIITIVKNKSGIVDIEDGAIKAAFSVSATRKVYFSQGNLQFNAALGTHLCADSSTKNGTWKFADNQWEVIGMDNQYISSTYNGDIDLFGWATSGWSGGDATNYEPWSTSTTKSTDYTNSYGYGPSTTSANTDLVGTNSYYDWGVYNTISNGGNMANKWRTLTQEEYRYLFNTRPNASELHIYATVNKVKGAILFPDNWEAPAYINYITDAEDCSINLFNKNTWIVMQQAGAVFLPFGMVRSGNTVTESSGTTVNRYWSASASITTGTTYASYYAYCLSFFTESGNAGYLSMSPISRCTGFPVRLVQNVVE